MRIIVMFDLPVKTKSDVKKANTFRRFLLNDGYYMVQYSIYVRVCNGLDSVNIHKSRLKLAIPAEGSIRILTVTEKQYANIDVYLGKKEKKCIKDNNANYELISFF